MTASQRTPVYLRIEERTGRDMLRDLLDRIPKEPEDVEGWARQVRQGAWVAQLPRWVRAAARDAEDSPARLHDAVFAAKMVLAGWSKDDWISWMETERERPSTREELLADFERKFDSVPADRPDEYDKAWWEHQRERRANCRASVGLWWMPGSRMEHRADGKTWNGGHIGYALGCGVRSCERCSVAAQWRSVSRYIMAFAAPLRKSGYKLQFVTLTSRQPVSTPTELRRWRKGIGQVLRGMRQGRVTMGIPPGSWRGGLCVVETVRKGDGLQYAHAHLLVVARRWYPYGRALRRAKVGGRGQRQPGLLDLVAEARCGRRARRRLQGIDKPTARQVIHAARFRPSGPDRYTSTGRLSARAAYAAAKVVNRRRAAAGRPPLYAVGAFASPSDRAFRGFDKRGPKWRGKYIRVHDPLQLFGLRELLRRNGCGEVLDVQDVPQETDARGAVLHYLSKVVSYASKVQTTKNRGASVADECERDGRSIHLRCGRLVDGEPVGPVGDMCSVSADPVEVCEPIHRDRCGGVDGNAEFWLDPQVQWVLRGVRRCQPFGDFLKLHAGPTQRGSELNQGEDHRRFFSGVVELEDFESFVDQQMAAGESARAQLRQDRARRAQPWIVPDPATRFELHRLNMERLREWGLFVDLGAYLPWLRQRRRSVFIRPERPELPKQGSTTTTVQKPDSAPSVPDVWHEQLSMLPDRTFDYVTLGRRGRRIRPVATRNLRGPPSLSVGRAIQPLWDGTFSALNAGAARRKPRLKAQGHQDLNPGPADLEITLSPESAGSTYIAETENRPIEGLDGTPRRGQEREAES